MIIGEGFRVLGFWAVEIWSGDQREKEKLNLGYGPRWFVVFERRPVK